MNRSPSWPLIIKFTVGFAILGMINALIGVAITIYINTHFQVAQPALYVWQDIVLLIWPMSLMMMAATKATAGTIFTLVVSVIANGYVYGMLGLVIGSIRHRYKVDTYGAAPTGLKGPARKIAKKALIWGGVISVVTNVLAVPWYIPAYRRTGTVFDWRATLHDTVVVWALLWVVIFLPLFLQAGLRARRETGETGLQTDD